MLGLNNGAPWRMAFNLSPVLTPESGRWLSPTCSTLLFLCQVVCDPRWLAYRSEPCGCLKRFPTLPKSILALPTVGARDRAHRARPAALRLRSPGWHERSLGRAAVQRSACARSAGPACPAATRAFLYP